MKHLWILCAALVCWSCSSPQSAQVPQTLPPHNLGASVNTPADDIAPFIEQKSGALYFTTQGLSDSAAQNLQACAVLDQDFAVARKIADETFDTARLRATPLARALSVLANNEGNIAFLNQHEGFFASGHPFQEEYARKIRVLIGGIVGGTDLFFFRLTDGENLEVQNLRQLNSFYWDAHPAAAQRGDTVLLVFASDRPARARLGTAGRGFSAPFRNQRSYDGRDTVPGNADLYYAFRTPTGWSAPRNLNDALGERINSRGSEYSPFLFCIERQPVLYFASDRRADASPESLDLDSTFNLWRAQLRVDFGKQRIIVERVEMLPDGEDSINTARGNELFPYIPHPHEGRTSAMLYFASDRDDTTRHWSLTRLALRRRGDTLIRNRGGFDLYRIPIETSCQPPRITYTVYVLDAENPARPVLEPIIRLERADGTTIAERRSAHATFTLDCGTLYRVRGGSLYDSIHCEPATDKVLSHYAQRLIVRHAHSVAMRADTQERIIIRTHDTLRRATPLPPHLVNAQEFDTAVFAASARLLFRLTKDERFVGIRRRSQFLLDMLFERPRANPDTVRRRIVVKQPDTLWTYDTLHIPLRTELTLSELSRQGPFPLCNPHDPAQQDIVLEDTVYVYPRYYVFPPCVRDFSRDRQIVRNVPYFQTTFWEVNTRAGLERHLALLRSPQFADAGFIELHRRNQYWGPEFDPLHQQTRQARFERRIEQYRQYARFVDRNFEVMKQTICDTLLPRFADMLSKLSSDPSVEASEKLIIQVLAYSDARPIRRGVYIGPDIRYLSAHYDTTSFAISGVNPVLVQSGAQLVGENNDTLSKLRAYYGYTELLQRLRQCELFRQFEARGEVLLPTDALTAHELHQRLGRARIIIVVEGRFADTSLIAAIPGYQRLSLLNTTTPTATASARSSDYFEYDTVRRVDVRIHRVSYRAGRFERTPCGCVP